MRISRSREFSQRAWVLGSGVEFCQADRASSVPLLIGTLSIDFLQFVRVALNAAGNGSAVAMIGASGTPRRSSVARSDRRS